jgi:hypothetical protein
MAVNNVTKIGDAASEYWSFRKDLLKKEHDLKMRYLEEKRAHMNAYYQAKMDRHLQKPNLPAPQASTYSSNWHGYYGANS